MKKEIYIARPRKLYTALLTSMLLFAGISNVSAIPATARQDTAAQITYVGAIDNLITFNVQFENPSNEKFILELTDEFGEVIYLRQFTEQHFNKNIQLKKLNEKCSVNFTVRTAKQSSSQRFEIDAQTRLVTETVVTKI